VTTAQTTSESITIPKWLAAPLIVTLIVAMVGGVTSFVYRLWAIEYTLRNGTSESSVHKEQPILAPQSLTKNAKLTSEAWEGFNQNDYEQAVIKAEECISQFQLAAEREQLRLQLEHAPMPPTGDVSPEMKKTILARGALNDVATCLWIKGESEKLLGHKVNAENAFKAAMKFSYACVWDPAGGGFVWSPAEASADSLRKL
jgi:hypothetical protein